MFRKSLALVLLSAVACPGFAQEKPKNTTVARALPVDPSEITPEGKANPAVPTAPATPPAATAAKPAAAPAAEITPLPPGSVKLAPAKPAAKTDAPDLANLPVGEDAVRLQIFLDQSNFGPGVIDGKPGRFTVQAVESWNEVHGHAPGDMGPVMAAAHKAVPNPFATAPVPAAATKWVNSALPYKREGQVGAKQMSYRSLAEFMSERFHTDVEFLLELNGAKNTWGAKAGEGTLIVPNVKPFQVEIVTGKRYEADTVLSERHAVVDVKKNQVRIFEGAPPAMEVEDDEDAVVSNKPVVVKAKIKPNTALVASFPITPGQPQFIHYGVWKLANSVELPVWRYDKSLLETGKRSNESMNIPPGPNSPVGIIWNGLSKPGIGLHGTPDPETIGRAQSHGCIRLANWDAIRIPTLLRPGATVEIRKQ